MANETEEFFETPNTENETPEETEISGNTTTPNTTVPNNMTVFGVNETIFYKTNTSANGTIKNMYVQFLDYFSYALLQGDQAPLESASCPETCGMGDASSMCCARVRLFHPETNTETFV